MSLHDFPGLFCVFAGAVGAVAVLSINEAAVVLTFDAAAVVLLLDAVPSPLSDLHSFPLQYISNPLE